MVEDSTNPGRGNAGSNVVRPVAANERGCISIADFLNANKHLLDLENARQRQV